MVFLGRARLFEVIEKVKEVNIARKSKAPNHTFSGTSNNSIELDNNPDLELGYIVASPRMAYYMNYSAKIYNIYLQYFSNEDIFPYSIDEIFCDITPYLKKYKKSARQLVTMVLKDVYEQTGITATAGIGTNMYLCKIAMDIVAKKAKPDENGVRIAALDEMLYRKILWNHRPLTDFWRVGKGTAKKLEAHRMFTMGDVARCSITNEDLLYKLFGVNAELLIDHAWGWECCTIASSKNYKPITNSLSSGQVLSRPYNYEDTKIIVKEMTELLSLDLVKKGLVTSQFVLEIGYDKDNLLNPQILNNYKGEFTVDRYGRSIPKHAHGTVNLDHKTTSTKLILDAIIKLYEQIVNKDLLVRRVTISATNVVDELKVQDSFQQIDLFGKFEQLNEIKQKEKDEKEIQKAIINIKSRYGKNAIVKGMNLQEAGTTIARNKQVGGHKA